MRLGCIIILTVPATLRDHSNFGEHAVGGINSQDYTKFW